MDKRVEDYQVSSFDGAEAARARLWPAGALMRRACNWRKLDDGVALSGQGLPLPMMLLLKDEQVRSMVNLRGVNWNKDWFRAEVADCAELGIEHFNVRLSSKFLPERAALLALLEAFDRLERPLLIKCAGGVDRSTFAAALYRLRRDNTNNSTRVRRDLRRRRLRHLYWPEQRWVRAFPDFYDETRGTRGLQSWIEQDYSVAAFEAFLRERGWSGSWRVRQQTQPSVEAAE